MTLYIFCTTKDNSVASIASEAPDLDLRIINYEDLSIIDGVLYWKKDILEITIADRIIIRWPWVIERNQCFDYNIFVQIMVDKHSSQIIMDQKCLSKYSPFYEDKLFQSFVFNDVNISTPRTWFFTKVEDISLREDDFPLVIKKRISSRSKHNIRVESLKELHEWLNGKNIFEFILQEYIEAKHDIRVLVLFDEVLGSVSREMHIRDGNRLAVKGMKAYQNYNHLLEYDLLKVTSYMGGDFVGFDLLIKEDGSYFLIEANMSPLFLPFAEATGLNVGKKIIDRIIT